MDTIAQQYLPHFFIVGHPKCGTTALYEMLKLHPQIYMPAVKEPNFFSCEGQIDSTAPDSLDQYLALFRQAKPGQLIGEASAFYLRSPVSASRIAEVRPSAKIIAILREPASFLRSLHLQLVQSDFETAQDLRLALSLENDRRQSRDHRSVSNWQDRLFYSEYVQYVRQLTRFRRSFPSRQIMVLIYDDFRNDNEGTLRRVLRFLEVDDGSSITSIEVNPTVRVRMQRLNHLIYAIAKEQGPASRSAKVAIKTLIPRRLRRYLWSSRHKYIYAHPPEADEELTEQLRHRFKPEVLALCEYLNRDLAALWGYDSIE